MTWSIFFHILLRLLWWGAVITYTCLILFLVSKVITGHRRPMNALAWVTALIFFPVGGVVLFAVFGPSLRNTRMISRRNRRKLINSLPGNTLPKLDKNLSKENRQTIRLAYSVADSVLYPDNDVELYNSGEPLFEAMFRDLARARHYIDVQFYIIAADTLGERLADILIERARAGVKVRLIYDYIGSYGNAGLALFRRLRREGVEVHSFFRINGLSQIQRLNWRNHRKVVVIDGSIGYIGGFNVAERYLGDKKRGREWRDLMARLTGPVVAGLRNQFAIDWNYMGQPLLTDPIHTVPDPSEDAVHDVHAQILPSGPTGRWPSASYLFFKAISQARRRVWIQTPYFLPGDELLRALQCAALSGVDVRVMTPRRADSVLLTHASAAFVEECLLAGIKVFFYEAGMLHAKLLLVDDDFSTLGSTNFDYRSFEHNFEENIVMYSPEVSRRLSQMFRDDLGHCTTTTLSQWARRPRRDKVIQALSRLLSPIL